MNSSVLSSLASPTHLDELDSSAAEVLAVDLVTLLKSLGANDVDGAKTAIARIETGLNPEALPTPVTPAAATSLERFLKQLNSDLQTGSTHAALSNLGNFLADIG